MALTTIDEYKAWNAGHGSSDAQLTTLLSVATAVLQRYCGRDSFEAADYTEALDGTGTEALIVRNSPINSITSIKTVSDDGTAGTAWDSSTYRAASDGSGVIHRLPYGRPTRVRADDYGTVRTDTYEAAAVFPEGRENIQVVYNGGYATVPDDLKWAVWMIMDDLIAARGRDSTMQAETMGGYSYTRMAESDELAGVRRIAQQWRRSVL